MTVDDVRGALAHLRTAGKPTTYDAVRDVLGGGSRRDIARHLHALDEAGELCVPAPEDTVPVSTEGAAAAPEPVPEAVPAPERVGVVQAAQQRLAHLEDRLAAAKVELTQQTMTLTTLRKRLAEALANGHEPQVAMLNEEVAAARRALAATEALLQTLPDAITLATDKLERARKTQRQQEAEHWHRVQTQLDDASESWVCGLLAGNVSRWHLEDVRQPVGETRVAIAERLKALFPPPIFLEDEQ